jgi:glucose-1-phosphate cytidylyltransferase
VHKASRYLDGEPFLVTYGDGLADVNIDDLRAFHAASGCLATVTTVQPVSRFGVMDVGAGGKVASFSEKPKLDGWINVGFFIMEPGALRYLTDSSVLEEEPLAKLAADGQLSAYRHTGFWQPLDTYRESKLLNDLWYSGSPAWRVW